MKKTVKSAWSVFAFYMIITGICFIAIHILAIIEFAFFESFKKYNSSEKLFTIGIIVLAIGLSLFMIALYEKYTIRRLKAIGMKYEAKIEKIERTLLLLKANRKTAALAVCSYINKTGNLYRVKSNKFILDRKLFDIEINMNRINIDEEAYEAIVYVNNSKPIDYAVEIFIK